MAVFLNPILAFCRFAGSVLLCVSLWALVAHADNFVWNVDGSGDWSVIGNWNLTGFPSEPTDNVTITNAFSDLPVVVTYPWPLNLTRVGNLTILANAGQAPHELKIADGAALVVDGTVTNNGVISLNSTTLPSGFLTGFNSVVLAGSGRLVLGANANNRIAGQFGVRTLTNSATHTIEGGGDVGFNLLGIKNQGLINANLAGVTMTIDPAVNAFGNGFGMENTGTLRASGGGTLSALGGDYINTGTFEALDGSTFLFAGNLSNLTSGTLSAGTYRIVDTGGGATMSIDGTPLNTLAAAVTVELSGAGATLSFGGVNLATTLSHNYGTLRVLNGYAFGMSSPLVNAGTIELGGAGQADATLTPGGAVANAFHAEIRGHGTLNGTILNSGMVRASGGSLAVVGGIESDENGVIEIDNGAVLDLSGQFGESSSGYLNHNGLVLNLGGNSLLVQTDYSNSHFGVGNAFNPRANVAGTGQIIAAEGVSQQLNGDVTNGYTENAVMNFGNVHVGDSVNGKYRIANTSSGNTAIRGAVQTAAGGGHVSDARLSGSGVTASNFGPLGGSEETDNLEVTFEATSAGALVGQQVRVVNNFENVADQTLAFTGAAYRLANPTAHLPEPIGFGNVHVGATVGFQSVILTNNVPNDGFSERLTATIGSATSGVLTNGGSIAALLPGQTNSTSLAVKIDTSTGGNKSGTATISQSSDGAGTSGLGVTPLATQVVNVTGGVFRYANPTLDSPQPLNLGILHVGDVAQRAVSLTNNVPNDGFSERLAAAIGSPTGAATTNGGIITGLVPGFTNTTNLMVGVNTATAGAKSGSATVTFVSIGAPGSGLANTALPNQAVDVTAQVNNFAVADVQQIGGNGVLSHTATNEFSLDLGSIAEQQPALAAKLAIANIADAPGDFLAGSFTNAAPNFELVNFDAFADVAPGGTPGLLLVELDSTTAGVFSGQIILHPQSTNPQPFSMDLPDIAINVTGRVRLAGDFNDDNAVNAADYTVWRNTLNQNVAAGQGADGDFDGQVTMLDYGLWKSNYGRALPLGHAVNTARDTDHQIAVPEPSTLGLICFELLVLGITAASGLRRGR